MADIYDRLTASGESVTQKLSAHGFAAGLRELARGAVNKAEIVAAFSLDETQEANLDSIIAVYAGLSTGEEKGEFLTKIEDVFILSEMGHYNKAKAKLELGF